MTAFAELLALLSDFAWASLLVFLRVAAFCSFLPGIGEQWLSVRVRIIVALMLTVATTPAIAPMLPASTPTLGTFLQALLTETVTGLFLGIVLRLFLLAIQTAGSIAAQVTSLAQLMGQPGVDPLPALGHVLMVAALALLMATGFHVKAAAFVVLSYDLFPAFELPSPSGVAEAGSKRVSESFVLAFSLAAPFVILSVLYNLTLGVINKAMPQLMVAFVGAPVITFGAIGLMFLCAPFILSAWRLSFEAFLANPF